MSVSPLPELTDDDTERLRIVSPSTAVLTSLENSDTDTASSNTDTEKHIDLPEPLTTLVKNYIQGVAGPCDCADFLGPLPGRGADLLLVSPWWVVCVWGCCTVE